MRGLILFLFLAFPSLLLAADVKTAGFVQGLWYDRAEIFAGETVRLYVAIRNNTGSDLTGRVEFKNNGKVIGSSNVSALNNRIIESWVDWTPTYGDHTITASLSRVELSAVGTTTRRVEVLESTTEQKFFVDYDTDKDGIGNLIDTDDDGDGIPDEEDDEPLIFNKAKSTNSEDEETSTEETKSKDSNKKDISRDDGNPSGLEKFLNNNRADTILTGVTNIITTSKNNLDEYRESRNSEIKTTSTIEQTSATTTNSESGSSLEENIKAVEAPYSSFGEITRSQANSNEFTGKIMSLIRDFISSVYTFILYIISVYLGHPAVVQMTLLFLIVIIIFKVAQRLSRRPY